MSSVPSSQNPANEQTQDHERVAAAEATAWKGGVMAGLFWGLLAGMLAWLVVQAVHPVFWTTEGVDEVGFLPLDVQWKLDRNNAMFVAALLGGLTGAGLAVSEVLGRQSWRTALAAGAASACVAALLGGLAGYLGHHVFELYKSHAQITDLEKAIRVHGVMFATLGCGVGLGAGISLGRSIRIAVFYVLGGLLAGVLAGITYPMIVAMLMPGAMTTVLIPQEIGERLLWFGLFAGLVGAIIPSVARSATKAETQRGRK